MVQWSLLVNPSNLILKISGLYSTTLLPRFSQGKIVPRNQNNWRWHQLSFSVFIFEDSSGASLSISCIITGQKQFDCDPYLLFQAYVIVELLFQSFKKNFCAMKAVVCKFVNSISRLLYCFSATKSGC